MPLRKKELSSPLLLANIGQLLTLRTPGKSSGPRRGPELNDVGLIKDAAVLCSGGKILAAGSQREVLRHPARVGRPPNGPPAFCKIGDAVFGSAKKAALISSPMPTWLRSKRSAK